MEFWLDKQYKIVEGLAQRPLPGNKIGVAFDLSRFSNVYIRLKRLTILILVYEQLS